MTETALRIDKWLWFTRLIKSRADAQKLVERGQVSVNGKAVSKTSATIRVGDAISVVIGPTKHILKVLALGTRRGPAAEAQTLYERTAPMERLTWEDSALPLHRHR